MKCSPGINFGTHVIHNIHYCLPLGMYTYYKNVSLLMTQVYSQPAINDLKIRSASILSHISKWYAVNGLFLNIDKTNVIKLIEIISIVIHFNLPRQGDQRSYKISWFQNWQTYRMEKSHWASITEKE